jgi:hypothetical protein
MLLSRSLAEEEIADTLLRQIARELLSQSSQTSTSREVNGSKERTGRVTAGNGKRGGRANKK